MDVIKTRLQTQNMKGGKQQIVSDDVILDVKYKDIVSSVKTIYKEEGARGFCKGAVPRAILSSVSSALSWVAYEFIKSMWQRSVSR